MKPKITIELVATGYQVTLMRPGFSNTWAVFSEIDDAAEWVNVLTKEFLVREDDSNNYPDKP